MRVGEATGHAPEEIMPGLCAYASAFSGFVEARLVGGGQRADELFPP